MCVGAAGFVLPFRQNIVYVEIDEGDDFGQSDIIACAEDDDDCDGLQDFFSKQHDSCTNNNEFGFQNHDSRSKNHDCWFKQN